MAVPRIVFLPYAWAVEFRDDFKALILERVRAVQYAADSHGILVPLYDLRSLEPPNTPPPKVPI